MPDGFSPADLRLALFQNSPGRAAIHPETGSVALDPVDAPLIGVPVVGDTVISVESE